WYSIKNVLVHRLIEESDVQEHGLFVAQVEVVLKLVIQLDTQLLESRRDLIGLLLDYLWLLFLPSLGIFLIIRASATAFKGHARVLQLHLLLVLQLPRSLHS
ncbi:MAG: hypothetical protein ACK55I_03705, partial [bacterium]